MPRTKISKIALRLSPLYFAAFFHGFVFWYPFEKIFITGIGFTDTTIGLMIALYSFVMLIAETPSGILADRWSRKGVLVIASCSLATASLIGGLSQNVVQYIIANLFWGIFFAMYSGTYESIVYDTLYEEVGSGKQFDFYYGRMTMFDSLALVSSSLLGALVSHFFGMRAGYFMTIPFALLPILFLLKFREPRLHKKVVLITIKQQITSTFRAVTRNKSIYLVVVSLVTASLLTYLTLEFSQLWYIALAAPLTFYGVANAVLLTSFGFGGAAASSLKLWRTPILMSALVVAIASSFGLVFARSVYVICLCLVLLTTVLIGITVMFNRVLHDSLDSNIRAGASSAISTLGRGLIIPTALLIGYLSTTFSIFKAAWIIVVLVILLTLFVFLEAKRDNYRSLEPK